MAFFKKLFEKKECSICGGEIGLLGNRKLEDGNCCKECAGKLSPWFDDRRHSTVEQIQLQLEAREKNREELRTWDHNMVFGEHQKIYFRFAGRIPDSFVISSSSDYKAANADIIPLRNVTSCDPSKGWRTATGFRRSCIAPPSPSVTDSRHCRIWEFALC